MQFGLCPRGIATFLPVGVRSKSKRKQRDAGVWPRRFWDHHVIDEDDDRAHVDYCWFNPVQHALVERPQDWPFSSYRSDASRGISPHNCRVKPGEKSTILGLGGVEPHPSLPLQCSNPVPLAARLHCRNNGYRSCCSGEIRDFVH